MMKMSLIFLGVFIVNVLLVAGQINNYQDILINLHNLPEQAKHFQRSQSSILSTANILEKPAAFSNLIPDDFVDIETTTSIVTALPIAPVISELCKNQTTALIVAALIDGNSWAKKMIDAAGKPPADLLDGDINWLGDYEECLAIHSNFTFNSSVTLNPVPAFNGEYCLVGIPLNAPPNPLTPGQVTMLQIGLCVPDSCSEEDAVLLFNTVLSNIPNNTILAKSAVCQQPDRTFDTRALTVMVIVCLFIAVMLAATAYDVIWIQWPKWQEMKTVTTMLNGEVREDYEHKIMEDEVTPLLGEKVSSEHKPGLAGKVLLSFSIYTNGEKILSTKQPPGSLSAVNGIRFISMSWVILGHTIGFSVSVAGLAGKILLSFSIYTNGAKILSTNQPTGSLSAVNGVRFISMSWVILGHTYVFCIGIADNAMPFFIKMFKRWSFGAILNALVSVDTFFTLSGLLLTYLIMKELKRRDGRMNWFMFYFHRFWRLTPPYMLILMTYVSLYPYTGSGPMWKKDGMEVNYCKNSWWYNFLYINNFVSITDPEKQCMGWSWYLANDMQFFVISPIIIVPLFFSKIAGMIIMAVFLLGTWITTGVISAHYELGPTLVAGGDFIDYFDKYYVRPYCRFGPYLVGMFTGYILYKTNCRCRINRYVNLLVWTIAAGLAITILYGLHDEVNGHPMSVNVAALYNAVHRTLWGACVCWVIFACATGNGGYVNTILSWKAFIPLSRLTYCAYLVHPIVIYYFINSTQRLVHFTDLQLIYLFLPNLCLSYVVAFVASLAYESPMMGLEKVIFKRGEKKD